MKVNDFVNFLQGMFVELQRSNTRRMCNRKKYCRIEQTINWKSLRTSVKLSISLHTTRRKSSSASCDSESVNNCCESWTFSDLKYLYKSAKFPENEEKSLRKAGADMGTLPALKSSRALDLAVATAITVDKSSGYNKVVPAPIYAVT